MLFGSLAPDGAVVKTSALSPGMRQFKGAVRVFDSEESAMQAILGGGITPGDFIVIRYEGPRGGPGMREMERRKAQWRRPAPKIKTGYLAKYIKLVSPSHKGAICT